MISITNDSNTVDTPYAQIPVWLIRAGKEVTPGALMLYAALKTYTKNGHSRAFPSQETLAEDMGVSSRQVRNYMQQLKDCGGMRYRLRLNDKGKKTRNYEYMLAWERPFTKDEEYPDDASDKNSPPEENFRSPPEQSFRSIAEEKFRLTTPTEHTPFGEHTDPPPPF